MQERDTIHRLMDGTSAGVQNMTRAQACKVMVTLKPIFSAETRAAGGSALNPVFHRTGQTR